MLLPSVWIILLETIAWITAAVKASSPSTMIYINIYKCKYMFPSTLTASVLSSGNQSPNPYSVSLIHQANVKKIAATKVECCVASHRLCLGHKVGLVHRKDHSKRKTSMSVLCLLGDKNLSVQRVAAVRIHYLPV